MTFPEGFDNFNDISLIVEIKYSTNTETVTAEVINTRLEFQLTAFSIPANTDFEVAISSLPTPKTAKVIDMNQLRVLVATSDKASTTAASMQNQNLVTTV